MLEKGNHSVHTRERHIKEERGMLIRTHSI